MLRALSVYAVWRLLTRRIISFSFLICYFFAANIKNKRQKKKHTKKINQQNRKAEENVKIQRVLTIQAKDPRNMQIEPTSSFRLLRSLEAVFER